MLGFKLFVFLVWQAVVEFRCSIIVQRGVSRWHSAFALLSGKPNFVPPGTGLITLHRQRRCSRPESLIWSRKCHWSWLRLRHPCLPTSVRCFSITGTWAGLNVKTDHSLHCIRAELDLSRWMVPHLVETSMCPCLLMTLVQLKILHNAECRLCTTRDAGDEISFYWE